MKNLKGYWKRKVIYFCPLGGTEEEEERIKKRKQKLR